jgi:hypothetical protein
MTWGSSVDLIPISGRELTKFIFEFTDYTYDPPVYRKLSLLDNYDSGVVRAEASKGGAHITVRSVRRK